MADLINEDILREIAKFLVPVPMKLREWIHPSILVWKQLSTNPNAIDMLEKNLDKVDWSYIFYNPNAIRITGVSNRANAFDNPKQSDDKKWWVWCFEHPYLFDIERRYDVDIGEYVIPIFDEQHLYDYKNIDYNSIDWQYLSYNPYAIELLEKNLDKVDWRILSGNRNAIRILEQNLDKIDWWQLSGNPNAIHLLQSNPNKINWWRLSGNQKAIHLLQSNPYNIDWYELSGNPSIFVIDEKLYETNMKSYIQTLKKMII